MAVPLWQPGTLYQPGDIVQPITAPAPTAAQVENGDFSAGNVNWDFTGGAEFVTTGGYSGNGACVRMPGSVPEGLALNKTKLVVPSTGSTFEASAMIQQGASIAGATRGWVEVRWYDNGDLLLSSERGNVVSDGSNGAWHQSKVTATRPAGAAYARAGIALFSVADHTHHIFGDNLSVSGTFAGLPDGLVYRAVQDESGYSAANEPAWPPILGQQVIDNDVIWEAVASTRVTWEASPLYVSGTVEPAWPTEVGGFVRDGTIDWKTVSRRVEDPNCPNTKIVAIAASKVFAGDDDIVRYSATVNPLDWSSTDDAGYLPTGLQNYGSNPVAAMGLYRGNLVVFNSEAFQLWQVDEDPASMALIDALPLGSTQHRSISPVANDLFFLASQGVRSIGIAASSTNYQAGDVGMPIDPLVEPLLRESRLTGGSTLGLYYPAAGQYWLSFTSYPGEDISISGTLPVWSNWTAYEGRLDINSAVGACVIESIDDSQLPPGWSVAIDNQADQIVVTGSADRTVVRPSICFSLTIRDAIQRTSEWAGCLDVRAEPQAPESVTTWFDATNAPTHAIPLPSEVDTGDLLVFCSVVLSYANASIAGATRIASRNIGSVVQGAVHYMIATGSESGTALLSKAGNNGRAAGIIYHFKQGTFSGVPEAIFDPPADSAYFSQDPPLFSPSWGEDFAFWIGGYFGRTTTDVSGWPFPGWRGHIGTSNGGAIPGPGQGGTGTTSDVEGVASGGMNFSAALNPSGYVTGPTAGSVSGNRCAFTAAIRMK